MKDVFCVVVADGTRARFLTLDANHHTPGEPKNVLVETTDLVNVEHKLSGREKFTNTHTGSNRSAGSGSHSYDDHRDSSVHEQERLFARDAASTAVELARKIRAGCLQVIADKKMLGLFRNELSIPPQLKLSVNELNKNLTQLPTIKLHEYLSNAGLLPARQSIS